VSLQLNWSNEIECTFTKTPLPRDTLDRAKYADYLVNYLKRYNTASYAFNINSEWGAGKTYFIKRWANSMNRKHPVIYFNCWKFDIYDEPLILILSEVVNQLNKLLKGDENTEARESVERGVTAVIKQVAPTLGKGLFKKLTGTDVDELLVDDEKNVESEDSSKLEEEIVSGATKALLSLHTEQQKSVEDFKKSVERALDEVLVAQNNDGEKRWSPMYVFIDELDRCRPTFAIEVLEVIKHIFDIKRIVFVIATDTTQLQHSICAVYGANFDATRYLMRFFDRSFSLPLPELNSYIKSLDSWSLIQRRMLATNSFKVFSITEELALDVASMIFESFETDLRSVEQILERVCSLLTAHEDEKGVILLLVIECFRIKNPLLYEAYWQKRISSHVTGEYQFASVLQTLNVSSKSSVKLPQHPDSGEYVSGERTGDNLNFSKELSVTSIFSFLVGTIREGSLRTDRKPHAQDLYFRLTSGKSPDLTKYKDYVELAANLS